jgi:hypothetical protein
MRRKPMQRPRTAGDPLTAAEDHLGHALSAPVPGREGEWKKGACAALEVVEKALRQHMKLARAPEGLFAEVDNTRSTLARQKDLLCRDHRVLLEECRALEGEARQAAGAPELAAFRDHAQRFLAHLHRNHGAETNLILESLNTDLGAGD